MPNEFMTASRQALRRLRMAQAQHERRRAKADRRFTVAEATHAAEVNRIAVPRHQLGETRPVNRLQYMRSPKLGCSW